MYKHLFLIVSIVLLISACEVSKEDQLKQKKSQLITLQNEIANLESEIGIVKEEKRIPVEAMQVNLKNFQRYVSIQSTVESDRNSTLSPQMAGIVRQVLVQEGDLVKQGQTLVKIDDSIQQRRLSEAKNRLEFIQTLFDRQKRVWEQKAGSEIEYLKAKNDLESMQKSIQIIEEEIEMLKLKAPFNGLVDRVNIKVGEMLSPGMPAIQLTSNSGLKVRAELSENYLTSFKTGDEVEIIFPDLDDKSITLPISSISRSIDAKDRVLNVFINIPGNKEIQPNMLCVTKLNDLSIDSALVVPINIVQNDGSGNYLYVAKENADGKLVAKKTKVKAGESYKDEIVITEGLDTDDMVITVGSLMLNDGDLIELTKKSDSKDINISSNGE